MSAPDRVARTGSEQISTLQRKREDGFETGSMLRDMG